MEVASMELSQWICYRSGHVRGFTAVLIYKSARWAMGMLVIVHLGELREYIFLICMSRLIASPTRLRLPIN